MHCGGTEPDLGLRRSFPRIRTGIFYAGEGLMTREAGRRDRDSTAVLGSLDVADLSL